MAGSTRKGRIVHQSPYRNYGLSNKRPPSRHRELARARAVAGLTVQHPPDRGPPLVHGSNIPGNRMDLTSRPLPLRSESGRSGGIKP